MAETWCSLVPSRAWGAGIIVGSIWNGGSNVIRITRIQAINTGTAAVSGTLSVGEIRRYTGVLAWFPTTTNVVTTPYDSGNAALSSVTIGYYTAAGNWPTSTGYDTVKHFALGNDEVASGAATLGAFGGIPVLGTIWDMSYGESDMQHLALRTNELLMIVAWVGAVGTADVWFEFTNAGS